MSEKKELNNEQLNNEELENVNGGGWFSNILKNSKNAVQEAIDKLNEEDSSK